MYSLPNFHDAEDNKTKEQLIFKLKDSNKLLSNVIEFYPDATLIIDNQGKVIAWNKAMEEMTGIKAEDMIGKDDHEYAMPFYGERRPLLLNMVELPLLEVKKRYKDIRIHNGKIEAFSLNGKLKGKDVILWGTASKLYGTDESVVGAIESIRDVSQHKQAETALRESERRLAEIIDFLPDATFAIDSDGNVVAWNRAIEEMTGIKVKDMVGKGDHEYAVPFYGTKRPILIDLAFRFDNELEKKYSYVKKEGDCLLAEIDLPVKGGIRAIWAKAVPFYDNRGNIIGAIESIRDITARKLAVEELRKHRDHLEELIAERTVDLRDVNDELQQEIAERNLAEEELRKSEKFLANTFDSIQDGISILDKDLNIIRVNHTIEKRFPHAQPIVGKKCYSAFHCRDKPCENCPSIMAIKEKTPHNFVVPLNGPHGISRGWIELYSFPLFDDDGNVVGVIEYSRDITDRRHAEEALRESEEKFRVLAETSSVGIFLYQDDRLIYANPAIEALMGYTKEEFLNVRFWDLAHPDFQALLRERGLARLRGEQVQSCYEIKFATKHGEDGWAELSAGLIEYKGKPAGIATIYDITRRKHIEKELETAKSQAELYLDLMGHDINNLNQVGIGFLELARDSLNLNEDGRSLLSKPLAALESSSRLIDNVRKLQKARSGELRSLEMDVGKVLSDVQQHYSHIPGGSVTINYVPVSGFMVLADELLYDVFSNIVGNAIKHSIRAPLISIIVEKAHEGRKWYHKIIVEDNGPGISDDLKPKIFDRHLRGNTKAKGSGIGLYLVKTLVENYDGKVRVEDRIHGDRSNGSRFIVMLPAYEPS